MKIGIGFSNDPDPEIAAKNAAFEAKTKLEKDRIDFAIIFFSIHYKAEAILPVIRRILNNTPLIGSSTTGIILKHSCETRGIGILTVNSDRVSFSLSHVDRVNTRDSFEAGKSLAQSALESFSTSLRYVFLSFVDGQLQNKTPFIKGIQDGLGETFPIVGASCSDDFRFLQTFQMCQNKTFDHSAVGILLGGDISVGIGTRHGWRPVGKPRTITQASGNIIQTIDNKPASHIFEEYFGDDAKSFKNSQFGQMSLLYPLGINVKHGREFLIRNTLDILDDGSIVSQGDVPQGSEVHIMLGNKESCKIAALEASEEASKNLGLKTKAKVVIVINSMARLKLQGRSAFEEIQKVEEIFGPDTAIFGMYSSGEICPLEEADTLKKSNLQNESIVILAIG
ncbi:MAG: FIST C-terminal domain-containing protein [Candidatus Omnitrophica bacterium]|nr:FIST C-terminal domain-containing protein [Candidatus Omnitrophota bacterium]